MIFVSVGTEAYPFNRLFKKIGQLAGDSIITEKVFCQTGSSSVKLLNCDYQPLLTPGRMQEYFSKADIIIVHAGICIMEALNLGKIPIVVPRRKHFGEAVDDHQLFFAQRLAENRQIVLVENIDDLKSKIINYNLEIKKLVHPRDSRQKTLDFSRKIEQICEELLRRN